MKTTESDILRKAEGTIARATGGRASWDCSALRDTAIRALSGNEYRPGGSDSPEDYDAKAEAFRTIARRTSPKWVNYFRSL